MADPRLETMPTAVRNLIDSVLNMYDSAVPYPNTAGALLRTHVAACLEQLYLCGHSEGAFGELDAAPGDVLELFGRTEVRV